MIAIATAAALSYPDDDQPLLLAALAARGCAAEMVVWNDPTVDWARYERVVIRSTWDYHAQRDAYVAWAERVAGITRLQNPAPVIRWNTDKRYLGELLARGVPVVPTVFLSDSEVFREPSAEYVVKPAISAGSRDTARFQPGEGDRAQALVDAIHASGRTVMVQPYQASVDARGETALVFFAGRFDHAICKGQMLRPGEAPGRAYFAEERITRRTPTAEELAVAEQVLAALPFAAEQLTYARVDLVAGPDGPLLLELEVTEPSLFLGYSEGAADRLVAAIVR